MYSSCQQVPSQLANLFRTQLGIINIPGLNEPTHHYCQLVTSKCSHALSQTLVLSSHVHIQQKETNRNFTVSVTGSSGMTTWEYIYTRAAVLYIVVAACCFVDEGPVSCYFKVLCPLFWVPCFIVQCCCYCCSGGGEEEESQEETQPYTSFSPK